MVQCRCPYGGWRFWFSFVPKVPVWFKDVGDGVEEAGDHVESPISVQISRQNPMSSRRCPNPFTVSRMRTAS